MSKNASKNFGVGLLGSTVLLLLVLVKFLVRVKESHLCSSG